MTVAPHTPQAPQSELLRMTVAQASGYSHRHPVTLRRALEVGDLHGSQRKAGGTWSIRTECLDAWLDGQRCPHQPRRLRASP